MARYQATENKATWRIVDREAVIIHTATSAYFCLNASGTWIWNLLTEDPRTIDEVTRLVATGYDRPMNEVAGDVQALFQQFEEADLLAAVPEAQAAPSNAEVVSAPEEYEPPQLVKFGDLETLILSGE